MDVLFTWNPAKEVSNRRKHGVSFHEAVEELHDALVKTVSDERHFAQEQRFFSIGETRTGRLLTVGHTDAHDVVRIITGRDATAWERRDYEEV
jgi:uncharacterized DUF497 family protein